MLLKNLKIELPNDPAILLLGIYPKEYKSGYNKGTCIPMFIAALFKIAKLQQQLSTPLLMNGLRTCSIHMQWNFKSNCKHISCKEQTLNI
jgi:hypothetical protein